MRNRKVSVVEDDEGDVVLRVHPYSPGQRIERLYLTQKEATDMYLSLSSYLFEGTRNDEAT